MTTIHPRQAIPLVLAVAFLFASRPACAADVGGEVAGGYSFVYDNDARESFPAGWFVSGGAQFRTWLAAVGEVSGNYQSSTESLGDATATTSLRVHAFLAGGRVGTPADRRVTIFGQFLAGAASESSRIKASGPGVNVDVRVIENDLCYQPGVGVDVAIGGHVRVRAGANVRFIRTGGGTSREVQLLAGGVYRLTR